MEIQPGPLPDPRQPTHTLCSQVQAEGGRAWPVGPPAGGEGGDRWVPGDLGSASSWLCDLGQVTLL